MDVKNELTEEQFNEIGAPINFIYHDIWLYECVGADGTSPRMKKEPRKLWRPPGAWTAP